MELVREYISISIYIYIYIYKRLYGTGLPRPIWALSLEPQLYSMAHRLDLLV